jgi:protein TonB
MTQSIKNSPDLNSPGKPGASSQNSDNKAAQSPRSNPVCLEVAITIRSLPTEASGLTQPIREEGRTVIVFDNGAVLRTTNNLPVGQTVILSNPDKRDVVCRVVGGRNLPNIKGYVEIEFLEPVNDFWHIHEDPAPFTAAPAPVASLALRETATPPPPVTLPVTPPVTAPPQMHVKPAKASLGSGPTFEDIPGLLGMSKPVSTATRELNIEPTKPVLEKLGNAPSTHDSPEAGNSSSIANWRSPAVDLPTEKHSPPAASEDSLTNSSDSARSHDFLSKGLTALEQPPASTNPSNGRTPLIVGLSTLVLAFLGGVVFFTQRGTVQVPGAIPNVTRPPAASEPQSVNGVTQPARMPKEVSPQAGAQTQALTQTSAQPASVDQPKTQAAVAAVATSPATTDIRMESTPAQSNVRRQEKSAVTDKQPDLPATRRPVIPNLKLGSPSAPKQKLANLGEGAAPLTDIAPTEAAGGSAPAGLLTSAGPASNPLAPPIPTSAAAPVSAPKMLRDAELISSTRPVYPASAKESKVQGVVTVSAGVDENGNVVSAKAMSGPILLRQAAVDSVKQWKFSPRLVEGKPAPSQVNVGVDFKLK